MNDSIKHLKINSFFLSIHVICFELAVTTILVYNVKFYF